MRDWRGQRESGKRRKIPVKDPAIGTCFMSRFAPLLPSPPLRPRKFKKYDGHMKKYKGKIKKILYKLWDLEKFPSI